MAGSKVLRCLIGSVILAAGAVATDAALGGGFCTISGCTVTGPLMPGIGGGGGGGGWGNDGNSGDPDRQTIPMWCADFPHHMWNDYSCDVYSPPPLAVNGCGTAGGVPVPDFLVSPQSAAVGASYGAIFTAACNAHDVCYGSSGANKDVCDARLNEDMVAIGSRNIPEATRGFFMPFVQGQAWAYAKFLQWEWIAPWTSVPAFIHAQDEATCRTLSAEFREICG